MGSCLWKLKYCSPFSVSPRFKPFKNLSVNVLMGLHDMNPYFWTFIPLLIYKPSGISGLEMFLNSHRSSSHTSGRRPWLREPCVLDRKHFCYHELDDREALVFGLVFLFVCFFFVVSIPSACHSWYFRTLHQYIFFYLFLHLGMFAASKTNADENTRENPHSPIHQVCRRINWQ